MRFAALPFAALALLAGCVSTTPYQKRGVERPHAPAVLLEEFERDRILQLDFEGQSIERFRKPDFSIGIVEFSEEGDVNPAQHQQVMELVRTELGHPDGAVLILFAHGWHHGCSTCDRDLRCFRSVLDALASRELAERPLAPRKIVGVYLGWRGRRFRGDADWLSIWDRKDRAEHIGRTGVKEFLNEVHREWEKVHERTIMVSVGHSLGGVMLFAAVKERLTGWASDVFFGDDGPQRIVRTAEPRFGNGGARAVRARFGDLVVLVNPALEAKEYRVFDDDLADRRLAGLGPQELMARGYTPDRNLDYAPRQLPVLITVASEQDRAVRRFFPLSRLLSGVDLLKNRRVFTSADWRRALGHYAPYTTHELTYDGPAPQSEREDGCACPERYDWRFSADEPEPLDVSQKISVRSAAAPGGAEGRQGTLTLAPVPARDCEEGARCRGWDPGSPFLVVRTDETVIRHHNDIFNPILVGFLVERLAEFEQSKRGRAEQAY
ncbi:MAG TPA: hypothetical protein VMS56_02495 [Thermoanaerobaculia bacterium]|nr:hypothetical protein [Thermoanaerobaculia bacterium]